MPAAAAAAANAAAVPPAHRYAWAADGAPDKENAGRAEGEIAAMLRAQRQQVGNIYLRPPYILELLT